MWYIPVLYSERANQQDNLLSKKHCNVLLKTNIKESRERFILTKEKYNENLFIQSERITRKKNKGNCVTRRDSAVRNKR